MTMDTLIVVIILLIIIYYFYKKKPHLFGKISKQKFPSGIDFDEAFENEKISHRVKFDFNFEKADKNEGKYLVFDLETTGLPINRNARPDNYENWPYIVQIAWLLFDDQGKLIEDKDYILKQDIDIPEEATKIHGITNKIAIEKGIQPEIAYSQFIDALKKSNFLISHNIAFDMPIIQCEFLRCGLNKQFLNIDTICTMETGKNFCRLRGYSGEYKYPTLTELFKKCFFQNAGNVSLVSAYMTDGSLSTLHRANVDVAITAKCFFKLKELNIIKEEKHIKNPYDPNYKIHRNGYKRYEQAIELEDRGYIDKAIELYESLVNRNFEDPSPYKQLATIYRKQKKFDKEIGVLEKLIKMYSRTKEKFSNRPSEIESVKKRIERTKKLRDESAN